MRRIETGATIALELSAERVVADVLLDGDPVLMPGDRVRVHGGAIALALGQRLELRRPATILRAGWAARTATRIAAIVGVTEMYEVSFSPGRIL